MRLLFHPRALRTTSNRLPRPPLSIPRPYLTPALDSAAARFTTTSQQLTSPQRDNTAKRADSTLRIGTRQSLSMRASSRGKPCPSGLRTRETLESSNAEVSPFDPTRSTASRLTLPLSKVESLVGSVSALRRVRTHSYLVEAEERRVCEFRTAGRGSQEITLRWRNQRYPELNRLQLFVSPLQAVERRYARAFDLARTPESDDEAHQAIFTSLIRRISALFHPHNPSSKAARVVVIVGSIELARQARDSIERAWLDLVRVSKSSAG